MNIKRYNDTITSKYIRDLILKDTMTQEEKHRTLRRVYSRMNTDFTDGGWIRCGDATYFAFNLKNHAEATKVPFDAIIDVISGIKAKSHGCTINSFRMTLTDLGIDYLLAVSLLGVDEADKLTTHGIKAASKEAQRLRDEECQRQWAIEDAVTAYKPGAYVTRL